jgi:hypothetical protein
MKNTKARHREILAAAAHLIELVGGVEEIDALSQEERQRALRLLAMNVVMKTGCTMDPARSNVAKAMRKARFALMQKRDPDRWGGARPNTGPKPLPPDQKRQRVSTRLGPGYLELAKAITEIKGFNGWGHTVEVALDGMIAGDPELRIRLIEMGVIGE